MGMDPVWLVMMNGTVIHHTTHPIVVDVRAVDGAVLMDVLLPLHPVFLVGRCEMLEAGVGSLGRSGEVRPTVIMF